jgi:DMSO reductase anchor subunit
MTSRNRRLLGVLLVLLAIGTIAALLVAGVPPLRYHSVHNAVTGETKTSTKVHWSVLPSAISLVVGTVLILRPRRERE